MYATEAFEKLPEEKKQHIIRICIEQFAMNGYDRTSTDKIVQTAGISKGILFHYFKNKKNLFIFTVRYAIQILIDEMMVGLDEVKDEDFFERIKRIVAEKQKLVPLLRMESKLCADALMNPPKGLEEEMAKIMQEQYALYARIQYETVYMKQLIPENRLRAGVTADMVVEMARMISEKITDKYTMLYKSGQTTLLEDQSALLQELDHYFQIIRQGAFIDGIVEK